MTDEIPSRIREMMADEEVENMRNRDGWATGTVKRVDDDGEVVETFEDAWIELFNGAGRAGNFGGVRFQWADPDVDYDPDEPWADDGGYEEAYAYPTREHADGNTSPPFYFVAEWNEDDVDFGIPVPG